MIVIAPGVFEADPASRLPWFASGSRSCCSSSCEEESFALLPVSARLRSSLGPMLESVTFVCATVFLNANLRFGAKALRISCSFSLRDLTAYQADRSHQHRSRRDRMRFSL